MIEFERIIVWSLKKSIEWKPRKEISFSFLLLLKIWLGVWTLIFCLCKPTHTNWLNCRSELLRMHIRNQQSRFLRPIKEVSSVIIWKVWTLSSFLKLNINEVYFVPFKFIVENFLDSRQMCVSCKGLIYSQDL